MAKVNKKNIITFRSLTSYKYYLLEIILDPFINNRCDRIIRAHS